MCFACAAEKWRKSFHTSRADGCACLLGECTRRVVLRIGPAKSPDRYAMRSVKLDEVRFFVESPRDRVRGE